MERNSLWFLAFFYLSNLGSFSIVNAANALVERRALQKKHISISVMELLSAGKLVGAFP